MANPTAKTPLFARRRREIIAFLQRQRKRKEQNQTQSRFITSGGDFFKTSDNEFLVVE